VPVHRSPAAGRIGYLEHVPGEYGPIWEPSAAERNDRQYIGVKTEWGPLLLALIGGPLARRMTCQAQQARLDVWAGMRCGLSCHW
jgi:phosphatidylserine decarboxylase